MTRDQLEFLISQHLDGTINPADRAALDERLAKDPDARALLSEYRDLDAVAKKALPLPNLDWQTLTSRISANITEQSVAQTEPVSPEAPHGHAGLPSIVEEYEFAIAQYADGTLPADQRPAFERRLATDTNAQRILNDYRSLDTIAKVAWPTPDVNWNLLQQQISRAVSEIEIEEAPTTFSTSLKWLRGSPALALAACLIIGLLVAIPLILKDDGGTNSNLANNNTTSKGPQLVQITGPTLDAPAAQPVALIELVEPPAGVGGSFAGLSSEVVSIPSRVELARAYRHEPERREDGSPF